MHRIAAQPLGDAAREGAAFGLRSCEPGPVTDQFYGDRAGRLVDPFGHLWYIATHKEDVAPEEIRKRAAALHG
jgi:hypothetical protein